MRRSRRCGARDPAVVSGWGLRVSRSMIALSRAALRARHPGLGERALRLLWIEQNHDAALPRAVQHHQEASEWIGTTVSSSP